MNVTLANWIPETLTYMMNIGIESIINKKLKFKDGWLGIKLGLISGWSCVEPEVGLDDPRGSLPTQGILQFFKKIALEPQ